jgi:hypothetical protein
VRTNPLLSIALMVSPVVAGLLLGVPTLARHLGQAPPTPLGLLLALLSFPVMLLVDAVHKRWLRHES